MVFARKAKQPANPRVSAGFFSKVTFWWLRNILWKGVKESNIQLEDIPEVLDDCKAEVLGGELERHWKNECIKSLGKQSKPSLLKALIRTFLPKYIWTGLYPFLGEIVGKLSLPFAMSWLIASFRLHATGTVESERGIWHQYQAHFYCLAYLLLSLLVICMHHLLFYSSWLMGMKMKVAVSSVIYRKTLRLSCSSLSDMTGIGQITNLLTNDVMRCDEAFLYLHFLWCSVLQFFIVASLVWTQAGSLASLGGTGFILLLVTFQGTVSSRFAKLRSQTAKKTDTRLKTMNEIITNMKMIKVYTWEKSFGHLVRIQRKEEMKVIWKSSLMRTITDTCQVVGTKGMHLSFLVPFVLMAGAEPIIPEKIYLALALLAVTRLTLTNFLPLFFLTTLQCLVCIKRIQQFLERDEVDKTTRPEDDSKKMITVSNMCANWPRSQSSINGLKDVSLQLKQGQLAVVTGAVGSGKTSLLQAILGEMPTSHGTVSVHGSISYASQESWIFSGTVKDNILFGKNMMTSRYQKVLEVCALDRDIATWRHGDLTLVGEKGLVLSGGQKARITLARALYKDSDIYLLDDPFAALDTGVGSHILKSCMKQFLKHKCVLLITHNSSCAQMADMLLVFKNNTLLRCAAEDMMEQSKILMKNQDHSMTTEEHFRRNHLDDSNNSRKTESKKEGLVSWKTYYKYFTASHSPCLLLLFATSSSLAPLAYTAGEMFLGFWSNIIDGSPMPYLPPGQYLGLSPNQFYLTVFSCIILLLTAVTAAQVTLQFCLSVNSSQNLHDDMFKKLLRAPLSYFSDNPVGQILNRFSKDLGIVDEMLPHTVEVEFLVSRMASAVLIAAYYIPETLLPILLLGAVCFILRRFYVSSSSPVRRLEAITTSPLLSQLNSTVTGIVTIRAFNVEDTLKQEFDQQQNASTSTSFMFHSLARWFGLSIDICVLLYQTVLLISLLCLDDGSLRGGDVGVILLTAFDVTRSVQYGMRMSALLDMAMTSTERIIEMQRLESEASLIDDIKLEQWPSAGAIEFKNVCLRYATDTSNILCNLTFDIKPKEKIGIVGRTGAGKSSLLSALFRLTEPSGEIRVDGLNLSNIGLHRLRKNIAIIPQDPLVMQGTLRRNLDPFELFPDDKIWQALEDSHLAHLAKNSPKGLHADIFEGGANLSAGEKQLLCLARAILPDNKILVMDEATANVDQQTDLLIQEIIREKFYDCTVLTVAHRLNTVIDADRIMVLAQGQIEEFDVPHKLLEDPESALSKLVKHERVDVQEQLRSKATRAFMAKQKISKL